jgi:tripartite-type tricarboxylate transporter receptor subunit TctC
LPFECHASLPTPFKVLQLADAKERFAREGAGPESMSREVFTDFVRKDIARWRPVVRDACLQQD